MEFIHDYQLIENPYTRRGSTVYRALQAGRPEPVNIELINTAKASPTEIAQFKYAYEKIRQLDINGVVHTCDVFDYQDGVAIVTENFPGHPLFKCFTPGKIDIENFLKLAGTLTRILGDIHSRGIVHQAVSPETVLCDPSPENIKSDSIKIDNIKLTGFGAAGLITHIHENIHDPSVIRNVLPYMAPEQTGRMNCAMDHRADLYAAGVLFYELLTGDVPFSSNDPIEIIHAHIARQPLPPAAKNTAVPVAVSNIVMKLLAKTMGDRYQSGYGAMADFIECARQLQKNVKIRPFGLGRHDIAVTLDVPEKIIGREKEINLLTTAFERITNGGNEIFLVGGPPGIGKSALIFEIQKFVITKHAYFITGKAEQYKRDIPYYPIIQAFTDLARQVLCEPDAQINLFKTSLLQAMGANSRLITDLVPNFEHIIGLQPEMALIGPALAQHRINYAFKEFVKIFATQAHPMVIFIDDLQWADAASLNFIRLLSTAPEEIGHLLIVGCYRNNEKNDILPLMRTRAEAEKSSATVRDITLPPLPLETIHQLIHDLLQCDESSTFELSEIVQKRTGGNPFFIRQFLKMLYDEKILTLNPEAGWTWDRSKVADIRIFDNMVDFMAAKIAGLPAATLDILKRCACYGTRFDLSEAASTHHFSIDATIAALAPAVGEGLISFRGNAGEFSHERIREGVYQLFPEAERMKTHYTIGRYRLNAAPENRLNEASIDIVNHFNIARELITSPDEQLLMADLNRRAGEKATHSGAFESAFHYFETGIHFLETAFPDKENTRAFWQHDYLLALALFSGGAETAYLIARYEDMYRLSEQIILYSRTLTDTVSARIFILHALMAQNKLDEALFSGLSVLTSLGVSFPKQPTKLNILLELLKTKTHLRGRGPDDFLKLSPLTDPAIKAQIDVMAALTSTAYWTSPNLLPLIIFRLIRIFATHGNMEYSPYIYAGYGLILCSLGEIDTGYKYGNMALTLLDRVNVPRYRSRTLMVVNTFIRHWKEHTNRTLAPLLEACRSGMEQGDIEFAAHSMMVRGNTLYLLATSLDELNIEFQKIRENLIHLDQVSDLHVAQIFHQTVHNLQDKSSDVGIIAGDIYDEVTMLPVHQKAKDRTCLFHLYVNKLMLNWLFGRYAAAYDLAGNVTAHRDGSVGTLIYAVSFYYDSLARISYFSQANRFLKKRILFRVALNQRKMKKWAHHSPENFRHKYHLVEAELARIRGAGKDAIPLYKQAITGAMEAGYRQEEALSCECLARFYLEHGIEEFAASYMIKARELYLRWGAHAKVRHLNEKYDGLFLRDPGLQTIPDSPDVSGPSPETRTEDRLDIAAIIKMSQAISSEIVLEKLLMTVIRVIAENSGAGKALLILNRNGQFEIDAEIGDNGEKIEVLQGIPVDESDMLCPGIISYVKRTREPLVLDDARTNGRFAGDPYICRYSVRSLLCLPLVRQQEVIGLIYLENNLTPNAFTPDRVEMITMLSTQAANCLENAIFFEKTLAAEKTAKKERERYQKLVETMNDGMGIIDSQLHITFANNALCRMTGYTMEELREKSVIDFLDDANQLRLEEEVANWTETDRHVFEIDWTAKDGGLISTIVSPKPIFDENGEFEGFLGIVTDVTDLNRAQREKELAQTQLIQSQKMEAIGMLAGGVAHDFNNYLTTILGSVDLITLKNNLPENLKKHIAQIKNAAQLSAALTRQLLAFGRRQMLEKAPINLNTIVSNIQKMLDRLIGENIQLTTRLAPDLKHINADFGQMEQIVMNLAVNARDAMPEGGTLDLKTENMVIDEVYCHHASYATPGEFICLTVEDSGAGMSREMMDKIFDPFFSTKGPGHGTGLGLSVVYGVVKQHQGWINVYSEPNQGTTFKIYLPVSESEKASDSASPDESTVKTTNVLRYQGNQERILLIEDQEEVRDVIVTALAESGYIVCAAATIAEAREWMARSGDEFDLLFSDVILPDGNGIDFAEQVIDLRPAIKILISSGYTEEKSRSDAIDRNRFSFLQKPYPLNKMFEDLHRIFNQNEK